MNPLYTVTRGTAGSVNSVFIQMAMEVDQCDIAKLAASIGVHRADGKRDGSDLSTLPVCSIGGCENNIAPLTQAAAYAAISNHGVYCEPIIVDDILDANGESLGGQVPDCGQSLVTPAVADTAAYAMQSVMGGTASASNPATAPRTWARRVRPTPPCTWMVGSSPQVATAVWVGNIEGEQNLRRIYVNGVQASVLRHKIFLPTRRSSTRTSRGRVCAARSRSPQGRAGQRARRARPHARAGEVGDRARQPRLRGRRPDGFRSPGGHCRRHRPGSGFAGA